MKPTHCLTILLLCSFLSIQAQDFNNYQLLKNEGTVPVDFLTLSSEKYQQQKTTIEPSKERIENEATDKFLLESNFIVDNMLNSSIVLYNDPITIYINKIADKLLKNDPITRKKLRFYAVRSSVVNAFATNQGIIFVNIGLLAKLQSEAQLAFILAHEITHVRHGHALDMFLKVAKIDNFSKRKRVFSETELNENFFDKNHYSKELETHADKEGLELFLKSNYNLEDLDGTFDVLQYSYLPFDTLPIEKEDLEMDQLQLADSLFLAKKDIRPILVDYEENESLSTHPSIDKRRAAVAKTIISHSNEGRQSYIVRSQKEFETLRDIARFELAYYHLHQMRFQDAFYTAHLLQQKYPQSKYLKKIKLKVLYSYTKFSNEFLNVKPYSEYTSSDVPVFMDSDLYEEIEGPSQQLYYFLEQLKPNEINVYALCYTWNLKQEYPEDEEINTILVDLFRELAFHYEKQNEFAVDDTGTSKQETVTSEQSDSLFIHQEDSVVMDYFKYALSNIHQDSTFQELFDNGQRYSANYKKRREYERSEEGKRELKARGKRRYLNLGIDSILVYNPLYIDIEQDWAQPLKMNYLKGEKREIDFVQRIQDLSKRAELNVHMLSYNSLTTNDTERLNDLRVLAEWLSQQNKFGGNIFSDGYNQEQVEAVIKKHNTPYLLCTGVVNAKQFGRSAFLWAVIFDLRTGSYQVIKDLYYRGKAGKVFLNAHVYDILLQIKTPTKEPKIKPNK